MYLQNTVKSLLNNYSLMDIVRVLRSHVADEVDYFDDFDDFDDPHVIINNVEQRLDELIDYCYEENFTPNQGEWYKVKLEFQRKINEQHKLYLENAEKEQFEKLKKKYG